MSRWVDGESFDGGSEREVLIPVREVYERCVPVDNVLCDFIEECSELEVVGVGRGGEEQLDERVAVEGDVACGPERALIRTIQNVHEVIWITVISSPSKQTHRVFPCLGLRKIRRPIDLVDLHMDVYILKIALDRLTDL